MVAYLRQCNSKPCSSKPQIYGSTFWAISFILVVSNIYTQSLNVVSEICVLIVDLGPQAEFI